MEHYDGWEKYRHRTESPESNQARTLYSVLGKLGDKDCALNGFCILEVAKLACDRATQTCSADKVRDDGEPAPKLEGNAALIAIDAIYALDRVNPGGRCDTAGCRVTALACIEMRDKEHGTQSYTCDDSRAAEPATKR